MHRCAYTRLYLAMHASWLAYLQITYSASKHVGAAQYIQQLMHAVMTCVPHTSHLADC